MEKGTVTGVAGGHVTVRLDTTERVGPLPVARHRAPTVEDPDAFTALPRVGDRVLIASVGVVDDRTVIGVLP